MAGWFAVKRGITEHPAMKGDLARVGMFLWLIENAMWRDDHVDIGGKPYLVTRGSLVFSQRFLAAKFRISTKALRNFLRDLENHGVIATSTAQTGNARETRRTQVTLCNYDKYQSSGNSRETTGKHEGNKEEQGNNIPVGAGADAPPEIVDFDGVAATAWRVGKAWLVRHGHKGDPGAIVGRWLKEANGSASKVLEAIEAGQRAQTQDPKAYVFGALRGGGGRPQAGDIKTDSNGNKFVYHPFDGWMREYG